MAAQGLDIDRSTLAGWTGQAAVLLDPIVSRIRDEVLKADKIHADDTPVPVLDPVGGRPRPGGYGCTQPTTRRPAARRRARPGIASRPTARPRTRWPISPASAVSFRPMPMLVMTDCIVVA